MGSILLDNSVIGSGSLIAAGSIIKSGMQIPCNSFVVGIPATVKRQTTCKERSMIEEGCRSYLEHLKIYCNL
jgi:carbonic anhydrase/acetyltransferase-like protein (isoleucine patch superfamily)